jgi:hemerythrin-like domain-containing protein
VSELFDRYQTLPDDGSEADTRRELAEEICTLLTVHATIEEEIFYPAAREVLESETLLNEAYVEHQSAKDLVAQIQNGDPAHPMYDACVKVLGEYVRHHVQEEEEELFPSVRETPLDLEELGQRLAARAEELISADEDSPVQ